MCLNNITHVVLFATPIGDDHPVTPANPLRIWSPNLAKHGQSHSLAFHPTGQSIRITRDGKPVTADLILQRLMATPEPLDKVKGLYSIGFLPENKQGAIAGALDLEDKDYESLEALEAAKNRIIVAAWINPSTILDWTDGHLKARYVGPRLIQVAELDRLLGVNEGEK